MFINSLKSILFVVIVSFVLMNTVYAQNYYEVRDYAIEYALLYDHQRNPEYEDISPKNCANYTTQIAQYSCMGMAAERWEIADKL